MNYFIFILVPHRTFIGSVLAGRLPRGKASEGWWKSVPEEAYTSWSTEYRGAAAGIRSPVVAASVTMDVGQDMDYPEFKRRFEEARRVCVEATERMVIESLPPIWMYSVSVPDLVVPSDLKWDERPFHAFHLLAGITSHPHDEDWMLRILFRDGFVPRWIDLSILTVTEIHTIFCATISSVVTRFDIDGNPHYTERVLKPWAIKSPRLPVGWKSVEQSGRFSILRTQQKAAQPDIGG